MFSKIKMAKQAFKIQPIINPIKTRSPIISTHALLHQVKPVSKTILNTPFLKTTHFKATHIHPMIRNNSDQVKIQHLCRPEIPERGLKHMGGMEGIKKQFQTAIYYLNSLRRKEYGESARETKLEVQVPSGYLLYGPPGTGKTEIARALGGETHTTTYLISASQLIGEFVGQGERLIKELFELAAREQKCIVIIDEIDSIAQKRFAAVDSGSQQHHNTLVNQFLSTITNKKSSVILIGTTNKDPNDLDPALMRPGRFDRHIYVPLPEKEHRKDILQIYVKDKNLNKDIDLETLATLSPGYSGAKIKTWVNEAAIQALERGANEISMDDFDQARTIMHVGYPTSNSFDPVSKRPVAIHEAGHAVVAHHLNEYVYKITISAGAKTNGHVERLPIENQVQTKEVLFNQICIKLAGRAAEKVFNIERLGSADDLEQAKKIATHMVTEEGMGETLTGLASGLEIENILQKEMGRAEQIIKHHKTNIDRIVDALMKHRELNRQAFLNVLAGKAINQSKLSQFMHGFLKAPEKHKIKNQLNSIDIAKVFDLDEADAEWIPQLYALRFAKANIEKIKSIEADLHFAGIEHEGTPIAIYIKDLTSFVNYIQNKLSEIHDEAPSAPKFK